MGKVETLKSVSNVRTNGTAIELGGREYNLKFTLNAMAELEDKYGSVETAFEQMEKGSFKAIRFVLWAALLEENEDLTEKQVGAMITVQDLMALTGKINEAATNDMPSEADVAQVPN